MTGTKNDLINYRIARAKDTYDDAFNLLLGCLLQLALTLSI